MIKVYILQVTWLTQELFDLLRELLAELGFELFLLDYSYEDVIDKLMVDDVLLVLIDNALDENDILCAAISLASSKGVSVVGIWPPKYSGATVPIVLEKHAAGGIVTCERDALKELLLGSSGETWLQPDGQSRPERAIKRGGC